VNDNSEQAELVRLDPAQRVVVQHHAPDPAVLGQHPRLQLDLLRREHTPHRRQQWIAVQQLQLPGELLHAVEILEGLRK
jgi:hypothetical protein